MFKSGRMRCFRKRHQGGLQGTSQLLAPNDNQPFNAHVDRQANMTTPQIGSVEQVLVALEQEHQRIEAVLAVIDEQLQSLAEFGHIDCFLIEDSLIYLTEHCEKYHHHKEDILFAALFEKWLLVGAPHGQASTTLATLISNHDELDAQAQILIDLIAEAKHSENKLLLARVASSLTRYQSAMRAHLTTEEEQIFPLFLSFFDDDTWEEIRDTLEANSDPLFGAEVDERFRLLSEQVDNVRDQGAAGLLDKVQGFYKRLPYATQTEDFYKQCWKKSQKLPLVKLIKHPPEQLKMWVDMQQWPLIKLANKWKS